jgi:hypothetical protein
MLIINILNAIGAVYCVILLFSCDENIYEVLLLFQANINYIVIG